MKKPVSISISKFTESVQAAVNAASEKHSKFKLEAPNAISVSYLIRGIPVPEAIASQVTLAETQALANDIAGHLGAFAGEHGGERGGAVYSIGRHIIVGIPVLPEIIHLEQK